APTIIDRALLVLLAYVNRFNTGRILDCMIICSLVDSEDPYETSSCLGHQRISGRVAASSAAPAIRPITVLLFRIHGRHPHFGWRASGLQSAGTRPWSRGTIRFSLAVSLVLGFSRRAIHRPPDWYGVKKG